MVKKNYRKIRMPEKEDFKYIIIDGEIFINVDANDNPRFLAHIFPYIGRKDIKQKERAK